VGKDALKQVIEYPQVTQPDYVPHNVISLKDHSRFDEKWLQSCIQARPEILGLGTLRVIERERRQPRAGRLDLLLEDTRSGRRYSLELQLGVVDESHIIRTVEYWDNERKRNPQVDHCAVICAESINGRFLNVISLFNGQIPLIALQVSAIQIENKLSLVFTKVLDEVQRGIDEDRAPEPEIGRADWEKRSSPEIMSALDKIVAKFQGSITDKFEMKYTTVYVGCVSNGRATNFFTFKPQRNSLRIDLAGQLSPTLIDRLEAANIEVLDYVPNWRVHPIRLTKEQACAPSDLVFEALQLGYANYFG